MNRLALALAAFLLLAAAPAEAQERCTQGRNVAADVAARVYTVKARWYACERTAAKPIRLAGVRTGALARVAYPYAAVTTADHKLRLFNVTDRSKAAMRLPGKPSDLVLTRDGVATVLADGQVVRMNAKGEVITLDAGPAEPGSLAAARNGAHVYWSKHGAAQTATYAAVAPWPLDVRVRQCGRSRARAVAADAGGWLLYEPSVVEFFGCANGRATGTRFSSSDGYYGATVASPFAAVVVVGASPYGSGENDVLVHDLRSTDETDVTGYSAKSWVSQLELTNRRVAYILEAGAVNIDGVVVGSPELFRLDRHGRVTKLDAGEIVRGSLALTPDTRRGYYVKDGVAREIRAAISKPRSARSRR